MESNLPTLSRDQERALLEALVSGFRPLPEIAKSLNLSLLDLLDHIASPRIQSRLVALEQAAAHTVRVRASSHLPEVLDVLTSTLHDHRRDLDALSTRTDEASIHARRHERVHLRRTAVSVLRLSRLSPLAPDAVLARITRDPSASPSRPGGRVPPGRGEGFVPYPSSNPRPPAPPIPQPSPASPAPAAACASSPAPGSRAHSEPASARSGPVPPAPLRPISARATSEFRHLAESPCRRSAAAERPTSAASLLQRAGALPGPAP